MSWISKAGADRQSAEMIERAATGCQVSANVAYCHFPSRLSLRMVTARLRTSFKAL